MLIMRKKKKKQNMSFRHRGYAVVAAVMVTAIVSSGCGSRTYKDGTPFTLQPGDLLFQDVKGGPFFEAVAKVTQGYDGAVITHVGIAAHDTAGEVVVIEALPEGVSVTSLESFLGRSLDEEGNPKVLIGRLRRRYRRLIKPAITEAFARVGMPYNHLFDIKDETVYYCSELVYVCFRNTGGGEPLFELQPMTFIDPDTQETFPVWSDYFAELESEIPEGMPGINPGGISRSSVLRIIHAYGTPTGWKLNGKIVQ